MLPGHILACAMHAGIDLVKILGLVIVGMPATLLVTAQVAILIRKYSKTEMEPHEPQDSMPPFSKLHYAAWGGTWLVSLAAVAFSSSTQVASACMAFGVYVLMEVPSLHIYNSNFKLYHL